MDILTFREAPAVSTSPNSSPEIRRSRGGQTNTTSVEDINRTSGGHPPGRTVSDPQQRLQRSRSRIPILLLDSQSNCLLRIQWLVLCSSNRLLASNRTKTFLLPLSFLHTLCPAPLAPTLFHAVTTVHNLLRLERATNRHLAKTVTTSARMAVDQSVFPESNHNTTCPIENRISTSGYRMGNTCRPSVRPRKCSIRRNSYSTWIPIPYTMVILYMHNKLVTFVKPPTGRLQEGGGD
ncbi:hypothetical protein JOM56_011693 [Amanita muscaria]